MLLVSFKPRGVDAANTAWRAGILQGTVVVDVTAYPSSTPGASAAGRSAVRGVLDQGPEYLEALFTWAEQQVDSGSQVLSLESIELGPPVPDPEKIMCLGINYREHSGETDISVPPVPMFFAKFRNALVGPGAPILLPSASQQVDYEGELAVIIGQRCKAVSEQDALRYVAGYSIMNDVSARDLQFRTSQYIAGKTLDTFAPMGPGIVPASAIHDPQRLELTTKVNGEVRQHANTSDMIYGVAHTIAFLSNLMTLEPGDIISTGTPSGVGFTRNPPIFLRDGDVVEVTVERIGTLRNPVKSAQG